MGKESGDRTLGWYAYAPLSGAVFVPREHSRSEPAYVPPPDDVVTVRLMNEYGVDWPLWPKTASELPAAVDEAVDEALAARLRAWADTFDQHFHYERGWDDPRVAAAHRADGEALRDALEAALPAPWKVELVYWETGAA